MKDLIEKWKTLADYEKKGLLYKLAAAFVGILLVYMIVLGYMMKNIAKLRPDYEPHLAIYFGFRIFPICFIVAMLIMLMIIVILQKKNLFNEVRDVDYRNLKFLKDTTAGDARWMTREEMEETYVIDDINDTDVAVFGQITDNGEEVIGYKKRTKGASMNQNVLVMAAMGMGKSFGPVRTNILQAIRRGESFAVTDPSGELYSSLSGYCKMKGLKVHLVNLDKTEYSEFWNVLEETINPETERLDGARLNDFVSIYMQNAPGSNKEDFWYDCALNLIKTVIGYTAWLREDEIISNFITVYKAVAGIIDDDPVVESIRTRMLSFTWIKDQIRKVAANRGFNSDELDQLLYEIQYILPQHEYNIGVVFNNILRFEKIEDQLVNDMESGRVPEGHPAKIAYLMYMTNDSENVKKSALQGAKMRFNLFTDENAKEFLSHDGIHIADITKEQTALFVILSDKTDTLKPIASLFFTFLFKDTQDAWDVAQQYANMHGTQNERRQLTVMLDEFFSLGVIGGSADKFGITMSNSRKREIHIWIIVQGYSQLAALYGPEIGNIIQGGCSTILYLGGNDPDTVGFISKFVGGKATVANESHAEQESLLGGNKKGDSANISATQRDLITENEARRWKDKVLIASQGQYAVRANPFPWIQHPAYEICADHPVSIYDTMKPIAQRIAEININKVILTNDPSTYVRQKIMAICGIKSNTAFPNAKIVDDEEIIDVSDIVEP